MHLPTLYKKLLSSETKEIAILQTVIKHCLEQSELSDNMLFNIMIKEITDVEAKENGLGVSKAAKGTKGVAPKDLL